MANFNVQADERGFEFFGVRPVFDENRYGELLDTFVPDAPQLTIDLRPDPAWGKGRLGKLYMKLMTGREPVGLYSDSNFSVTCAENTEDTNNTLLHETKHFIDDATGEVEAGKATQKRNMNLVLGGTLIAGVALGTTLALTNTGDPACGLIAVAPAIPLMWASYWWAPHEIAARQFAVSPEITAQYGNIISFRQA